jgi:ribulose-5-phosphate 4-epimerase/fuculose-1-phosphate aldolase
MYREVKASNLLKIDLEGNKILPSPHPVLQAGFVVHRSVHMCREDVVAVMHSHSVAGVAVACQEQGLLPMNLNSMVFDGRIAYHDCEGITIDVAECDRIAASLGSKDVMILRNHGLLACGNTVGAAFANLYNLELACQMQLAAQSSGAALRMPPAAVIDNTKKLRFGADQKSNTRVAEQNAILWAAMRRWMDDLDPSYAE